MKQINRTPVPIPGVKATPKPKPTPSRTPVPLPGAKATSKSKATPSRTPVPVPGATPTRKPKDTPPKTPLSQEFIASDDDSSSHSDSSAADTSRAKTAEKPKVTIAVHKPNGVVTSTPKSKKKDNAAHNIASTPHASVRKPSVTPVPVPVPVPVPNGKRKADASENDGGSSDSSSDESDSQQAPQQASQPAPQQALQPALHQLQSSAHAAAFEPTQPYTPPKGFAPVPINDTTTSKVGSIFDNLSGKQVWHITAPAGVSLADLQELAMEDIIDKKTVLNDKGAEYRLSMTDKSEDGALEVMVPRQDGYRAVSARISRTLHVQAVAPTPALSSSKADQYAVSKPASITRSTIRAPRAQVKRLKMRFLPAGFAGNVAGVLGDSESETESPQRPVASEASDELRLPLRTDKQKDHHVNGVEAVDLTSTKSRKHRTPEEIKRREERRAKKEKRRAQEAARTQP